MYGSIICGVDGSDESRSALRVAAHLSDQLGLRLVLAHVCQPSIPIPEWESRVALTMPAVDQSLVAERLLEQVALGEAAPTAERHVLHGWRPSALRILLTMRPRHSSLSGREDVARSRVRSWVACPAM